MESTRHKRRLARGWYALLLAALLYVAATAADRHLKRAPHAGYLPPRMELTAYAPDLSHFWRQVQGLQTARVVSDALPRQVHHLELAVRKATGVRPTPARCRVWLGEQVLAGLRGGEWAVCFKPGLLMRGADALMRLVGAAAPEGAAYRYGGLYYAWRDEFLIAASVPELVAEALAAPEPAPRHDGVLQDAVRFAWRDGPRGWAVLRAATGLPVEGALAIKMPRRGGELRLAGVFGEEALVSVGAQHPGDIRRIAEALAAGRLETPARREAIAFCRRVWRAWALPSAPEQWDAALEECAVACTRVSMAGAAPVPELAAAFRTGAGADRHPLAWLTDGMHHFPYVWGERAGLIAPLWQGQLAACLTGEAPYWYAASREPAMDALLANLAREPAMRADLLLRARWEPVGLAAARLLQHAGALELVPGMGPRDVQDTLLPFTAALGQLGALELRARFTAEEVEFSGVLTRGAGEAGEAVP